MIEQKGDRHEQAETQGAEDIVVKMNALDEMLAEIKEALETVMDEEQEAFDNMPEGLQDSERGEPDAGVY